ncbi:uncharacterized protein LOC122278530 [Carya illinoinensis]|uniref:uncharacterized protein LOC122278530 n=1 Tax=Carya illinoinensis TaxID=32201 RepID=UPI001C71DDED|nr:uncharacterized protein LOC122278530 [Carya illinoinensis]
MGIRHGDLLSPYPFIFCPEALSSLLNHAEASKFIVGIPIARRNSLEWSRLIGILDIYERALGQKLTKEKISIHFIANTSNAAKDSMLSVAGVRSSSSYEKYLGLPALIGRSRLKAFKTILDRVRSRISNWKSKFVSQAGKKILLKAVVQALPTYCMGLFKLPKTLLKEVNKVMHHFW